MEDEAFCAVGEVEYKAVEGLFPPCHALECVGCAGQDLFSLCLALGPCDPKERADGMNAIWVEQE